MPKLFFSIIALFFFFKLSGQNLEPIEIDDAWLASIEKLAPAKTRIATDSKKKILIFAKATGFDHWTIPHNSEMLKVLAKKTNAFEVHVKYDIEQFEKNNLNTYDAVIFNNCNPHDNNLNSNKFNYINHIKPKFIKIFDDNTLNDPNLINYIKTTHKTPTFYKNIYNN